MPSVTYAQFAAAQGIPPDERRRIARILDVPPEIALNSLWMLKVLLARWMLTFSSLWDDLQITRILLLIEPTLQAHVDAFDDLEAHAHQGVPVLILGISDYHYLSLTGWQDRGFLDTETLQMVLELPNGTAETHIACDLTTMLARGQYRLKKCSPEHGKSLRRSGD